MAPGLAPAARSRAKAAARGASSPAPRSTPPKLPARFAAASPRASRGVPPTKSHALLSTPTTAARWPTVRPSDARRKIAGYTSSANRSCRSQARRTRTAARQSAATRAQADVQRQPPAPPYPPHLAMDLIIRPNLSSGRVPQTSAAARAGETVAARLRRSGHMRQLPGSRRS